MAHGRRGREQDRDQGGASHIVIASQSLELHAFDDSASLARRLAEQLDIDWLPIEVHRFPDEESLVRVRSEGAPEAIVLRALDRPNPKLPELLFAADALRRRGVGRIVLVAPYLGYMRQDRVFREGEAVSQQVVARLLDDAFDAIVTVEAHLHRIHALAEIFDSPAQSLSAAPAIAGWCDKAGREAGREALLVGPDAESEPWVRALAEATGLPWIVGEKQRLGDRDVAIELPDRLPSGGRGAGPELALLVDDIASSGATLAAAAKALQARGIERIEAVVVHALFAPGAEEVLRHAGLVRIVSTDTLSHPSNEIGVAGSIAAHLLDELGLGSQT